MLNKDKGSLSVGCRKLLSEVTVTASSRIHPKAILARTIVACMAVTTVSTVGVIHPGGYAMAQHGDGGEVASTSNVEAVQSMEWALRESFINYVGGATSVSGGASKNAGDDDLVERGYRFALKNVSFDEGSTQTRAEFSGTVHFLQYCGGQAPARGNCDLDLEFSDPTVVVGEDSYLEVDVYAKQYPSGDVFEKKRARIATINPSSARFSQDGKVARWNNLVPTLTVDGVRAFSNFYNLGSPLAPVSFSYVGAGGMPAAAEGGRKLVGGVRTDLKAGASRAVSVGDYLVVATTNALSVVDARTMQQIHHLPIVSDGSVWVISPEPNVLFFLDDGVVKQATVGPRGLENITEVIAKDEAGPIAGIASARTTEGWVLYAVRNLGAGNASLLSVTSDGSRSERPIRNVRSTIDGLDSASDLALSSIYGENYWFSPMRDMAVLADGSLLFFPATGVDREDGTWRVPPLRIDPLAEELETTVIPGGEAVASTIRPSGMVVAGDTVAFYNSRYTKGSRVQFFTYDNGALTALSDAAQIDGIYSISGIVPLDDGTAVVTAEGDGSLNVVDMETLQVNDKQTIPNTKGTSGTTRVLVVRSREDIITGGLVTDTTTYEDYLEVNRFATSEALAVDSEAEDKELLDDAAEDSEDDGNSGGESSDSSESTASPESSESSEPSETSEPSEPSEPEESSYSPESSEPTSTEPTATEPAQPAEPTATESAGTEPTEDAGGEDSAEPSASPDEAAENTETSVTSTPSSTEEATSEQPSPTSAESSSPSAETTTQASADPTADPSTHPTEPSVEPSGEHTSSPQPAEETATSETTQEEDRAPAVENAEHREAGVHDGSADADSSPRPVENPVVPISQQQREEIAEAAAADSPSDLARTGAAVRGLAITAGIISVLGVALILRARLRRSKQDML